MHGHSTTDEPDLLESCPGIWELYTCAADPTEQGAGDPRVQVQGRHWVVLHSHSEHGKALRHVLPAGKVQAPCLARGTSPPRNPEVV